MVFVLAAYDPMQRCSVGLDVANKLYSRKHTGLMFLRSIVEECVSIL